MFDCKRMASRNYRCSSADCTNSSNSGCLKGKTCQIPNTKSATCLYDRVLNEDNADVGDCGVTLLALHKYRNWVCLPLDLKELKEIEDEKHGKAT